MSPGTANDHHSYNWRQIPTFPVNAEVEIEDDEKYQIKADGVCRYSENICVILPTTFVHHVQQNRGERRTHEKTKATSCDTEPVTWFPDVVHLYRPHQVNMILTCFAESFCFPVRRAISIYFSGICLDGKEEPQEHQYFRLNRPGGNRRGWFARE